MALAEALRLPCFAPSSGEPLGVSESYDGVRASLREIDDHRGRAVSNRAMLDVLGELSDVATECSERGWDGYDGEPVRREAVAEAALFVEHLPAGVRAPEGVVPEPDGSVGLEWRRGAKILVVSFAGNRRVAYAASLGGNRDRGIHAFVREVPDIVKSILQGHFV